MRADHASDSTVCRAAAHATGLVIPYQLSRAANAACTVGPWIKLHIHELRLAVSREDRSMITKAWIKLHIHELRLAGRHAHGHEADHDVVDRLQRVVRERSRP